MPLTLFILLIYHAEAAKQSVFEFAEQISWS